MISPADIRARLADTAPPADPAGIGAQADGRAWPQAFLDRFGNGLLAAAVLIPIIDSSSGLSVLLTERAADLTHHAGQISFPGGRMEAGDADLRATALRETYEEVGIDPARVDVAGYLGPTPTVSGFAVTPVVGLLTGLPALRLDRAEVARTFVVPLEFLMDAANQQHTMRNIDGIELPLVEFRYGTRRIWGATAAMLVQLRQVLVDDRTP